MIQALIDEQAIQCGFAFTMFMLMASCLTWRRPLDMDVLGELANLFSWSTFAWLVFRFVDIAVRGQLGYAFSSGISQAIFWTENLFVLIPALAFRSATLRRDARMVFRLAVMACAGGMLYRFAPTTLSFEPGGPTFYFPALPEVMVTLGLLAFALAAYTIAVKALAILPAPLSTWYEAVDHLRAETPALARDPHGNPIDD